MSELATSRHKIESGKKIASVIRTMKVMASINVREYETAHIAALHYYVTVKRGLLACLNRIPKDTRQQQKPIHTLAIVFGSEQGLVGQFNSDIATFVLPLVPNKTIIAVGERVGIECNERNMSVEKVFSMPNKSSSLTALVRDLLEYIERRVAQDKELEVVLFHNHSSPKTLYEPIQTKLIPLDIAWHEELSKTPWPTNQVPEIIEHSDEMIPSLLKEYLFITLARACSESLVAENKSRLVTMRRAEKKINECISDLEHTFNLLRQNAIDEELFDVISGFLSSKDS